MDDEWIDIDPQTRYERFYVAMVVNGPGTLPLWLFVVSLVFWVIYFVVVLFFLPYDRSSFFLGLFFLVFSFWQYERTVATRLLLRMQARLNAYQEAEQSKAVLKTGDK